MNRLRILIATLSLVLCGCALRPGGPSAVDEVKPVVAVTHALRSMMLGRWYGEAPLTNGGKRQWLTERFEDGTFRIQFHTDAGEGPTSQTEAGFWGVSGQIYFTITRGWLRGELFFPADPTDAMFYDAYEILEFSAERFRYRNPETGNVFDTRKVGEDFQFPPITT